MGAPPALPERYESGAGVLLLSEAAAARLAAVRGLSFEALFALPGTLLDRNRLRDVARLADLSPPLYRKRFFGVKVRERLRALAAGRWLRNHAAAEARTLAALGAQGFRVPAVAGLGEGRDGRALLLLEELPGRPLRDCYREPRAVAAAARLVAALLARHIEWPDLDARHVFVGPDGEAGFLDVARLRFRRVSRRGRARMAARLRRSVAELPEGEVRLGPIFEVLAS